MKIMLLLIALMMSGCASIQKKDHENLLDSFVKTCARVNNPEGGYYGVKDTWSTINKHYIESKNRKLVVFMDGTSNTKSDNTNIWKLYKYSLKQACTGDHPVIPYYDKGVGANWSNFITGGFAGSGASKNIRQAYRFLVQTYKEGDEIFIFGFSRGAFTARSLNGMLYYVGLLKDIKSKWYDFMPFVTTLHSTVGDLYKSYKIHDDGTPYFLTDTLPNNIRDTKINLGGVNITTPPPFMVSAIGVFDTVPALGLFWNEEPDNHRLDLYAKKASPYTQLLI